MVPATYLVAWPISAICVCRGNLLATPAGDLCYLDFGMMSEAPENARYAIIAHVVHLVNRDYEVRESSHFPHWF